LFCFLTLMAGSAMAKEKITFDDLLLEDGTTLKNVVVLKVEPDGLRLEHKNGVSKVKFEELPEMVQKQFAFDRNKAEEFRLNQETAKEARAAEERRIRVEGILQQRKEEQDGDLLRAREAFYKLVESDEYSYPQLDKTLMDSIAIFTEAGRKDLASLLQDDRKLLRDREMVRPGEKYRREREQLQDRIRNLENQVAAQANQPPVAPVAEVVPFYVDRPVIIDRPIVVDANCPPEKPGIPPKSGPVNPPRQGPVAVPTPVNPRPAQPNFTPTPAPASRPVPSSPGPARPTTAVSLPSSGAQQQGAHLWKKN
ncbi:MAG TPA: hypothetical protein VHM91_19305, partial [Verrucomicrobiales bacterium]|nr:hypothetical protein [Verrucomicrobiales bacterium]